MSFIWGFNTGEQLKVTIINIHVCAVLYHVVSRALSCRFTLSYNTLKNAFTRLCAPTSCRQPPIQSFKIPKTKHYNIIIVGTSCKEALPGGAFHVARLNFKTSHVGVYKCLSLIVGFAVTVAIWVRDVVSCRDFILHKVATFWAMSLVRIYPGRASVNTQVSNQNQMEYK